ncbi:MAG: tRNA threonylcarbamoyladenosine biosynthesis protein TsaB [Chlamydiae bacterium]|nr:tRNA threonylcarbamoyladenosine biosynthesis protein TsaB [Chlamydiota bacterium]
MTNTLILDTSTERGVVALAAGSKLLLLKELPMGLKSSHSLMTILQEVFQKYPMDLQAIAVTVGPGSFTGIRVAAAAAKGLALARSLPLVALSSLAGFISPHEGKFASVIDARVGGAYVLIQERVGDEIRELGLPELCPKEALPEKLRECLSVVGPSFQKLPTEGAIEIYPDAAHLAKIAARRYVNGDFFPEGKLELTYLNNPAFRVAG